MPQTFVKICLVYPPGRWRAAAADLDLAALRADHGRVQRVIELQRQQAAMLAVEIEQQRIVARQCLHGLWAMSVEIERGVMAVGVFGNSHVRVLQCARDRKSVVAGKSVSVRVDIDGRRIVKKKKNK